jgi:HPt (histidine-containing phosphotransfer) domain-containing protein
MPELTTAQRRQLAALREDYEAGLEAAVAKVVATATSLGTNGCHRPGLRALRLLAHRLAGSSAVWGFSAVSTVAARLEDLALRASEASPMPEGEFARQSKRLARRLRRAVPTHLRPKPAFKTRGVGVPSRARRGTA